jgi:hypothetical protein
MIIVYPQHKFDNITDLIMIMIDVCRDLDDDFKCYYICDEIDNSYSLLHIIHTSYENKNIINVDMSRTCPMLKHTIISLRISDSNFDIFVFPSLPVIRVFNDINCWKSHRHSDIISPDAIDFIIKVLRDAVYQYKTCILHDKLLRSR